MDRSGNTALQSVPATRRRNRVRDTSWTTLRRQILETIAAAARAGHIVPLRKLGVSYDLARRVAALDPQVLADLAANTDSDAVRVLIDNELLLSEIAHHLPVSRNRELALELLGAGATRDMLRDLQLVNTNAEIEPLMCIAHQGRTQVGGKPACLTDREIRQCHELWRLRNDPESLHPIRHLTQTAHHLNLPVISIWRYLHEASNLEAVVEGESWAEQYPWIRCLYPKWGVSRGRHGRF